MPEQFILILIINYLLRIRKLCLTSTLPKVIDGGMYKEEYDLERLNFDKLLKIGQQYNVNGVVVSVQLTIRLLTKILRTIPRISWIEGVTSDRHYSRRPLKNREDPEFVSNSVTHLNTSLGTYKNH